MSDDAGEFHFPGVYRPPPVALVPIVRLVRWQAYLVPDGTLHLSGFMEAGKLGRVTGPILCFEPKIAAMHSSSGRRFDLDGPPGPDEYAGYVWLSWLSTHRWRNDDVRSVSDGVWTAIERARSPRNCAM